MSTSSKRKPSGAMADIVAQGQENVERLTATFSDTPTTELATDYLRENQSNPRRHISEASIAEMVNSIVQCDGVIIQPLLVRPISRTDEGFRYEVVCGNRRLRGAQRLGMKTVPVRIREMDDDTAARFAVWENLGREDLSAMDLAESINDLRKIDGLTWDEIGEKFGFSRQWGWQQQKLAELPESVRDMVREGSLKFSSATLIATKGLSDEDVTAFAERAINENLSYRALDNALKSKDAIASPDSADGEPCKGAFTWSPPPRLPKRKFARVNRATQDMVDAYNAGIITPEYAASLRSFAERLLTIADGGNVKAPLHEEGPSRLSGVGGIR